MLWLDLLAALFFVSAIATYIPKQTKAQAHEQRMRAFLGFEQTKQRGTELGLKIQLWHYLLMLVICAALGVLIALWTSNIFLVLVGVAAGLILPQIILEDLIYRRKRKVLVSCVPNLRLLTSKLEEGGNLENALQLTVPLMNGVTKPIFHEMHRLIASDNGEPYRGLEYLKSQLTFRRIEDLCEKLITGRSDGFSYRTAKSLDKTTDDISLDILDIESIELKNNKSRFVLIVIHLMIWTFPFMFAWMEGNLGEVTSVVLSIQTITGKILLTILGLNFLLGCLYLNRLTRFDMKDA